MGKSGHGDFKIGRTQMPGEIEAQKDRFPTRFQMYDASRIDSILGNEDAGDLFQMAPGVGNGRAWVPLEGLRKDVDRPIIKRKRRIKSRRLG